MATKAVAVIVLVACLFASSGADGVADSVIGSTAVFLDHSQCFNQECNLANFVTEAMLDEQVKKAEFGAWTGASIAATDAGSFGASLSEINRPGGVITYNDLRPVLPFNNTFDVMEIQGRILVEALELSATKVGTKGFLHWAGLKARYDLTAPVNSRVKCVSVLCRFCRVPRFEPINLDTWYRVTINDFITDGGDGYTMFVPNLRNRVVGRTDLEVVSAYIAKRSPITQGLDERVFIKTS